MVLFEVEREPASNEELERGLYPVMRKELFATEGLQVVDRQILEVEGVLIQKEQTSCSMLDFLN